MEDGASGVYLPFIELWSEDYIKWPWEKKPWDTDVLRNSGPTEPKQMGVEAQ